MTGLRCDDRSLLDQWSCPSLRLLVCLFVIGNGCICVYICICVFEVHSYSEDILWNATNSWGSNFQDACIYASICTICTSNEKSSLIFQRNCGREKMILCREKATTVKTSRIWGMSAFLLYLPPRATFSCPVARSSSQSDHLVPPIPPLHLPVKVFFLTFPGDLFRSYYVPCIGAWVRLRCCYWSRDWGPGRATSASPPCCSRTRGSRSCSSRRPPPPLAPSQTGCHCADSSWSPPHSWCSSSPSFSGNSFESSRRRIPPSSPSPLARSSHSATWWLEQPPGDGLESFAPWNFLPSSSRSWFAASRKRRRTSWTGWSSGFDSATAAPWNSLPSSTLSSPTRCSSHGSSFLFHSLTCVSIKSSFWSDFSTLPLTAQHL